jgi:predicted nucleotidyltransferase
MNPPIIERIVDLIVPLVEPDQIVLFGSYARGDYTKYSDVDLLVIKKGLEDEDGTIDKIYYSFLGKNLDVDVDVLAIDYDRYLEMNDVIGYIYRTIKREGKVIYEQS